MAYEAVIGLECHIQVASRTKMFCGCPAGFGSTANSTVCPVCLGLPGALPVANALAIEATARLGLALGCEVREESVFARKNYFYPDMPKNYQISQYDRPLCEGGSLAVAFETGTRSFALTRIHIEEDTGKSFHPERQGDRRVSRVDFNRAGVPLMELVTDPVFRAAHECAAFLTDLRRLVRWLGISGGDMEKGQLRCDANVSLRPVGATALGTKTELKNLNSIKGVEKGVVAEIERQRRVLEDGGRIEQATLLYDADHDKLAIMRSKEHAHDYRYFPEPDLPTVRLSRATIEAARGRLPELPWQAEARLAELAIGDELRSILVADRAHVERFDALVAAGCAPRFAARVVANWELARVNSGAIALERLEEVMPAAAVAVLARREAAGE
ncbi:MAG: Asp-tRNA(Asn)/Glu-tRNA(Gln) amidotransferase subunit GatB, partial [Candidatus Eisenbacteria bacterium]|nr:Asp-tRNA(Asn)/Glu-tRNA(Gln) amidotransferase subunit GatB [Candidatus Eisenbacteria bacterium]